MSRIALARVLVALVLVVGMLVAFPAKLLATVAPWPDWAGHDRTLVIKVEGSGLGGDVATAVARWNAANTGWTLVIDNNATNPDVVVKEGDKDQAKAEKDSNGNLSKVTITIQSSSSGEARLAAIMHELGHAMRVGHSKGTGTNVMDGNPDPGMTPTTLSAEDIAEAKASCADPPCPLACGYVLLNTSSQARTLTAKPGTGVTFDGATSISIACLTGSHVTATVTSWDLTHIYAVFSTDAAAEYNEVYQVTVTTPTGTHEYTGVLIVTDTVAPGSAFPHAIAGDDITVGSGEPVVLNGNASYHDDSNVFMDGYWEVTDGSGAGFALFHIKGELDDLPVGEYTATLVVTDYYGRTSTESINVTVNE